MKKRYIALWSIVGILVFAGIIILMFKAGKTNTGDPSARYGQPKAINASEDWVRGDINAKVTLIEYADFQCPACAIYYPVVKDLETKFGSQLAVVYRYFPLLQHKNGEISAMVAEAAGRQGKFWEMHDKLFEAQKEWSDLSSSSAQDQFLKYAQGLALDGARFTQDEKDPALATKVQNSKNEGNDAGINATPTFFFNGEKIVSPTSYAAFSKLVSDKIPK